jgi:lipoate-protein ligase B
MSPRDVHLASFECVPYGEALELQRRILSAKIDGDFPDTLLLLEHPPVITLGRRGKEENIRVCQDTLQSQGIDVYRVERGGDVTYHGPGQIVGYPIFALSNYGKDVPQFVSSLEEVIIRVCQDLGIEAARRSLNRGVWVGEKKIASIGLAVRRWISFHGFALNGAPNMNHFRLITPCGLSGVEMTSVAEILGEAVAPDVLRRGIRKHFEEIFEIRLCEVDLAQKLTGGPHEHPEGLKVHQGT